jgi:class 3 adenylate cyclase
MPPRAAGSSAQKKVDNADDFDEEAKRLAQKSPTARLVESILDGKFISLSMMALTVVALWGDDVRVGYTPKDYDILFDILDLVMLFAFTAEFLAASIVKDGYKWGFFFWLDGIAAASLITETPWVMSVLRQILRMPSQDSGSPSADQAADSARTARAARFARLVRLVRLIRIVKLYSMVSKANDAAQEEKRKAEFRAAQNAKVAALKRIQASKLGKVLSEATTRKVIVGMLMMLMLLPYTTMTTMDKSQMFGLKLLFNYGSAECSDIASQEVDFRARQEGAAFGPPSDVLGFPCLYTEPWITAEAWASLVVLYSKVSLHRDSSFEEPPMKLLWLRVPDPRPPHHGRMREIGIDSASAVTPLGTWPPVEWTQADPPEWAQDELKCTGFPLRDDCMYRKEEVMDVYFLPWDCLPGNPDARACEGSLAIARFDKSREVRITAIFGCWRTLFVCVLLFVLNQQFQDDTETLVIAPITKMVTIIKQLAMDPLKKPEQVQSLEEAEALMREMKGKKRKKKKKKPGPELETAVLENTILRIGDLIQVGFGTCGKDVIGNNMSCGDGELAIMTPGQIVDAVLGYVDLRGFQDITVCLQEHVTFFINTVADILYHCVSHWHGVPSTNYGDSFLIVWKAKKREEVDNMVNKTSVAIANAQANAAIMTKLADCALFSFVKVYAEMRRSKVLEEFARSLELFDRYKNGFYFDLGVSLHRGWTVEGPIGTDFKLEAVYISPHVATVQLLDLVTKAMSSPILLTEKFYMSMSLGAKERCRRVDTMRTGTNTFGIYTFDIDPSVTGAELVTRPGHRIGGLVCPEELLETGKVVVETLEAEAVEHFFKIDCDVQTLQEHVPKRLALDFRQALCYVGEGAWEAAAELLVEILKYWPDGPSKFHLQAIDHYGPKVPEDWAAAHNLDYATLGYFVYEAPPPSLDGRVHESPKEAGSPQSPQKEGSRSSFSNMAGPSGTPMEAVLQLVGDPAPMAEPTPAEPAAPDASQHSIGSLPAIPSEGALLPGEAEPSAAPDANFEGDEAGAVTATIGPRLSNDRPPIVQFDRGTK